MITKAGKMSLFFSVLVAVISATALQAQEETSSEKDLIKLKNGAVFEGLVLSETAKDVTLRIGPGQVLVLTKSKISTYIRRSENGAAIGTDLGKFKLRSRSQWFRLKEASGRVVGSLHLIAKADKDDLFRFEEQWNFHGTGTRTVISRIEKIDLKLKPRYSYYREVVTSTDGKKLLNERILQATVNGNKYEITQSTPKGRTTKSIYFQAGNQLPLATRELLRQGEAAGAKSYQVSIYDAMEGSFEFRAYTLSQGVPLAKALFPSRASGAGTARLIENSAFGRIQREWISREGRVLLMEVNGLELVAEPVTFEIGLKLQHGVNLNEMKRSPSYRLIGGFELWLPRASWSFTKIDQGGTYLHMASSIPDTELTARFKRKLDKKVEPLMNVAMTILREWKLGHSWFVEEDLELVNLAGREWIEITGAGKNAKGRRKQARLLVCEAEGGHLLLASSGGSKHQERFDREFSSMALAIRPVRKTASLDDPGMLIFQRMATQRLPNVDVYGPAAGPSRQR